MKLESFRFYLRVYASTRFQKFVNKPIGVNAALILREFHHAVNAANLAGKRKRKIKFSMNLHGHSLKLILEINFLPRDSNIFQDYYLLDGWASDDTGTCQVWIEYGKTGPNSALYHLTEAAYIDFMKIKL